MLVVHLVLSWNMLLSFIHLNPRISFSMCSSGGRRGRWARSKLRRRCWGNCNEKVVHICTLFYFSSRKDIFCCVRFFSWYRHATTKYSITQQMFKKILVQYVKSSTKITVIPKPKKLDNTVMVSVRTVLKAGPKTRYRYGTLVPGITLGRYST